MYENRKMLADIKVHAQLRDHDRLVDFFRSYSEDKLKEFEDSIKNQNKYVKERIAMVSLFSGHPISEKAYNHLCEMQLDEFVEMQRLGFKYKPIKKPVLNKKTGKVVDKVFYVCDQAAAAGMANINVATQEELDEDRWGLEGFESRRDNGMGHRDRLNSMKRAISAVRHERNKKEIEERNKNKKMRIAAIAELGDRLLADLLRV
jgi:hypothetical protein